MQILELISGLYMYTHRHMLTYTHRVNKLNKIKFMYIHFRKVETIRGYGNILQVLCLRIYHTIGIMAYAFFHISIF